MRCLDLHLELQVGSRVTVGLGDLQQADRVSHYEKAASRSRFQRHTEARVTRASKRFTMSSLEVSIFSRDQLSAQCDSMENYIQ